MNEIRPFEVARFFETPESAELSSLSKSDCEPLSVQELLAVASGKLRDSWERLSLGYEPAKGREDVRDAIAVQYETARAADLLLCAPVEGIFLVAHALLRRGQHMIAMLPGYQPLYEVGSAIGCEVSQWRPREEEGWFFDPDDLKRLIRPDTRLIAVNFPHNPTGFLPEEDAFREIIDLASERGITLLCDEMFRMLETDPSDRLPSAVDVSDTAVVLSGLSKVYGLGGLRLGWIASRDPSLLERMEEIKDYTTSSVSAASQMLGLMALEASQLLLERNRKRIEQNLVVLGEFFERHREHLDWVRPKGGTICFPSVATGDADAFAERLQNDCDISIVTSPAFEYGTRHFRLGLGRSNVAELIGRVDALLGGGQPPR